MDRPVRAVVALRRPAALCPTPRPRAFLLRCAAPLLLLAGIGRACAIGPEAPVDFLDAYQQKGFLLLAIEPDQLTSLDVDRVVYRNGEPVAREPIEWRALRMMDEVPAVTRPDSFRYRAPDERDRDAGRADARIDVRLPDPAAAVARPAPALAAAGAPLLVRDARPQRMGALIPLAPERHRDLKPGAYAERYTARARLAGAGAKDKPLAMARWVYFLVEDGRVRYIDQAEYARVADPDADALDGAGERIRVRAGRDVKADVPLERTRRGKAIPLGRIGGVAVERESAARDDARSEARER